MINLAVSFQYDGKVLKNDTTLSKIKLFRESGDKQIRDEIILGNIKLVYKVINRYFNSYKKHHDDLFQAGVIGLLKTVRDYKLGTNTRFSTYAFHKIVGEIRKFIRDNLGNKLPRKNYKVLIEYQKLKEQGYNYEEIAEKIGEKKLAKSLSFKFNKSIFEEVYEEVRLIDTLGKDTKFQEEMFDIREFIDELSNVEQKVFKMYFWEEYPQPKIAEEIGYSQPGVAHIVRRIRRKYKEEYINDK